MDTDMVAVGIANGDTNQFGIGVSRLLCLRTLTLKLDFRAPYGFASVVSKNWKNHVLRSSYHRTGISLMLGTVLDGNAFVHCEKGTVDVCQCEFQTTHIRWILSIMMDGNVNGVTER